MNIPSLDHLWPEWFDLYNLLSAKKEYANQLAGLFVGHVPTGFADQPKKILYVGKATRGQFRRPADTSDDPTNFDWTLQLHQKYAAELFADLRCGGFWPFADKISKEMDSDSRSNLAWTNLCKMGMTTKNPSDKLIDFQKSLAIQTLRAEIDLYRPDLVVFVTNNFAKQILFEAVNAEDIESWSKSEMETPREVEDIWWRRGRSDCPAILWMRHPQGATREQTGYAIKKMREIT